MDITQTSLQMQAHLSFAQRAVLMNAMDPDAAWTRHSLAKEYRRRGIKYKKVRPKYGFRKASQATFPSKIKSRWTSSRWHYFVTQLVATK